MNPFSRKKQKKDNEDLLLLEELNEIQMSADGEKPLSPYVLTRDEIESKEENNTFFPNVSPFEELRKKIIGQSDEKELSENSASLSQEEPIFKSNFSVNTAIFDDEHEQEAQNEDLDTAQVSLEEDYAVQLSAFEDVFGPYPEQEEPEAEQEPKAEVSLFQMCMPFLTDSDGELPKEEPLYVLDSVEKILGLDEDKKSKIEIEEIPLQSSETVIFDKPKKEHTADISDIDVVVKPTEERSEEIQETQSFTKTLPVIITPGGLEESREIDISSEIFSKKSAKANLVDIPEKDPDEDFTPKTEYNDKDSLKSTRHFLLKDRRNRFLMLLPCVISLILLGISSVSGYNSANGYNTAACVCSLIGLSLSVFAGYDCYKAVPSLFTKRCESDLLFLFTQLGAVLGAIFATVYKLDTNILLGLSLLSALNTFIRNIFLFSKSVYIYRNFRIASTPHKKQAVTLIDDVPTTFAMAHRAIDGDVLVTAGQDTGFVKGFMKNSTVDKDLYGNVRIILIFSIILTTLCSLAIGIYHKDALSGILSFSGLSSLFCPFILFGVNSLPLSSAGKRLTKYGSALLGVKSALNIEQSNAIALDCNKIFPKGTIKLHSLKILTENNLEETIAIAAAITQTIGSPLYPIFKAATETNKEVKIPVADSIKYEERLGITGWVGEGRVFIGNRALMLAHEIPVGDAHIDKQLLSEGYFPVYLARDGKACALLAVSYEPKESIARELRKITAMGVTLLINNCDQNLCEEMLCDYFDLYSDSVKIMSGSGVHMYKNATSYKDSCESGAVVTGNSDALAGILSCSIRIKRAVTLLAAACIVAMVIGIIFFAYKYFLTASLFIDCFDILSFKLISFAITLIAYLFTRP